MDIIEARELMDIILENPAAEYKLTPWEMEFIDDILLADSVSEKQADILLAIVEKLRPDHD